MTSLILEVYDAFKSVGVDDETARKAAGALSDNPKQIADLRAEMNGRFDNLQAGISAIRSERLVVWTLFVLLTGGVASLVLKAYF